MISQIVSVLTRKPGHWLLAGIAATIVLAVFMEGVARIMLGGPMKPAMLIIKAFGLDPSLIWLTEALHYSLGIVVFPAGYVAFLLVTSLRPGFLTGILWGFILWLGASLILAPLASKGIFFGGGQLMVASLVAHIAYGLVLSAVYSRRENAHV